MLRPSLIALIALCFSVPASARDIHVSNTAGDDRFTGRYSSEVSVVGGPVRTIAKALRLAAPGDRIVIANTGEPYRETVSLVGTSHSGNVDRPFIVEGNGAVLDGASPVSHRAWEHVGQNLFRFRPARLGTQQLFLFGKPAVRKPALAGEGKLPTLAPLEWCLTGGYIYFRTEDGRTPQSYQPTHAHLQTGITLYKVRDVVVRNFVVQGFHIDGVNAHDGVFDGVIEEVTARGNGRSGVSVGGASRVVVEKSLLGDNGVAQLRTEGYAQARTHDCELLDNTAPAYAVDGGRLWVNGREVQDK